jgi:hypothetical protein
MGRARGLMQESLDEAMDLAWRAQSAVDMTWGVCRGQEPVPLADTSQPRLSLSLLLHNEHQSRASAAYCRRNGSTLELAPCNA